MDFSLCGETIKTCICSLSKKLIPIAVIAGGLKKVRGKEGTEGWTAIIAAAFSASRMVGRKDL
ncbi:hypothetical protein X777_07478 [Ooceraea biroi]|uniref:Uncharacterized protein n=1 Tax=Ooceraea biroi TaxID=2015173 RepID=A0A026X3L8_OOCBI|nr:hypothetical protein X777_07478 [Ooceraea biroi]